jgi:hypothetical protein
MVNELILGNRNTPSTIFYANGLCYISLDANEVEESRKCPPGPWHQKASAWRSTAKTTNNQVPGFCSILDQMW